MKRLITFVVALFFLLVSVGAQAAWTITETKGTIKDNKVEMRVVRLACTSDGSGTDWKLETDVTGWYLYAVRTDPDGTDVPSGVYTVDVEDELDFHILDLDSRSTTAIEMAKGSNTVGIFPMIMSQPSVVVSTLGDTKKADIYLYFVK